MCICCDYQNSKNEHVYPCGESDCQKCHGYLAYIEIERPKPEKIYTGVWISDLVKQYAAQQSVHPTRGNVAQKSKSKSKGSVKPARG